MPREHENRWDAPSQVSAPDAQVGASFGDGTQADAPPQAKLEAQPNPARPGHQGTPAIGGGVRRAAVRAAGAWHSAQRWLEAHTFAPAWLPEPWRHPAVGYLAAGLLQLAVTLVTLPVGRVISAFAAPAALLLLVVAFVAITWGAGPSLLATLWGALLLDYVTLPPRSLSSGAGADLAATGLYVVTGLLVSVGASRVEHAHRAARAAQAEAEARSHELEAILAAIPDRLTIFDAQGTIRRLNPAAEQSAGP